MSNNRSPEKQRGFIQKLFNIDWNDVEKELLILTSCDELNDTSWGAWFGEIQDILQRGCYEGHNFKQCHIDLSYCKWGDPLPLLSLALTLNEYELTGGDVAITLPIIPSHSQIINAKTYLKLNKENTEDELIELMQVLLDKVQIDYFNDSFQEGFTKTQITTLKQLLKSQSILIVGQARFLKYLCREGFIELFTKGKTVDLISDINTSKSRTIKFGNSLPYSPALINELHELPVSLAFERSTCLKATVLELGTKNIQDIFSAIDKWVEKELHQSISQVVYEEVPSWAQDSLKYRLMLLLRETLHNVVEHAYENKNSGFAAVYVRYREGALGEDSTTWRRLEKFSKREEDVKKTPLFKTRNKFESFSNTRSGFFEVFVLDSGQGLSKSLSGSSTGTSLNDLHQSMLNVFLRGKTSKGNNRPTQYGGLYLLRELLSPHQDYFRARDNDTWWGIELPLFDDNFKSKKEENFTVHAYGKQFGKTEIRGLAWTVRLSWREAQDQSGHNQLWRGVEYKDKDEQAPIRELFKNSDEEIPLLPSGVVIQDSRFSPFQPYRYSDIEYDNDVSEFLFLPRPLLMKNIIQIEIETFLETFKNFQILNLVIGDVPSEEAITYIAAIASANTFQKPPFSQIERIIIVTRELRVCILTRDKNKLFIPNKLDTEEFFLKKSSSKSAIHNNITHYLRILRRHDSHRIKEVVTKNLSTVNDVDFTNEEVICSDRLKLDGYLDSPQSLTYPICNVDYINEEVIWSDGLKLEGYLDFPQSLTHPLCREIYSLSLKRLTGLSINGCRLESLDSLVDSLITRFNAQIHPRRSKMKQEEPEVLIQIGSIKVTGYTEESENQANNRVFHFFRHPTGKAEGSFLLPWIGTSENIIKIENISQPYMRVGKTPVIARGGWKSYEIPRFDEDNRCIYEKNPKDSYRTWQEPSLSPMKLGHWVYGGHHEIFTVNLLLAFDSELDRISSVSGNSLAKFTYANFFRVFNVEEKDLNKQSESLILSIKEGKFNHLLPEFLWEDEPLLVYPSHPVTDHIINEFLSLLEERALSRIRNNLIAILPVRRHRSGSGLQVSGVTLERLKNAIEAKKDRPVVYFDDGVISGRTFVEVKRLLRGMGYGDIYSVVLLDRQRLPSVHHLKNDKHVGYWRLDAPSMGSKAHCPLCHAIDKIIAIEDSIVSEVHKQRMKEWCDTWKELDPSTQWGNKGLRPIPLNLKKPNRRFCLRYDSTTKEYKGIGGEKEQEIILTNSAGLIAWVTELHTITSRDDFSLQLIKKESENLSEEVRIQLLASQLLLFSAEFDTKHAKTLALSLIEELWKLAKHDRHSALANLVIVSCVKEPFAVVKEFLDLDDRWSELKEKNIDFILLVVTTLISCTEGHNQINELEKNSYFEIVSRLLKPHGKSDLYYRLHREVLDTLGNAHSSSLQRFVAHNNEYISQTNELWMDALASASQINVIAKNIFNHWHWLRAKSDAHKHCETITKKIKDNENILCEAIKKLRLPPKFDQSSESEFAIDKETQNDFSDAKMKGQNVLDEGKRLHDGLFSQLGVQQIKNGAVFPFLQEIDKFNKEHDVEGIKKIIKLHQPGVNETKDLFTAIGKKEIKEVFVVWDAEIIEAVRDTLSNVCRTKEEIENPWKPNKDEKAHLWCRLVLSKLTANIEMKNKTTMTTEEVNNKTKNSHSRYIIEDIGGNVSYSKDNDNLLITTVSLPYAHTLQILSKGEVK